MATKNASIRPRGAITWKHQSYNNYAWRQNSLQVGRVGIYGGKYQHPYAIFRWWRCFNWAPWGDHVEPCTPTFPYPKKAVLQFGHVGRSRGNLSARRREGPSRRRFNSATWGDHV